MTCYKVLWPFRSVVGGGGGCWPSAFEQTRAHGRVRRAVGSSHREEAYMEYVRLSVTALWSARGTRSFLKPRYSRSNRHSGGISSCGTARSGRCSATNVGRHKAARGPLGLGGG